jgi:hypothetical protein
VSQSTEPKPTKPRGPRWLETFQAALAGHLKAGVEPRYARSLAATAADYALSDGPDPELETLTESAWDRDVRAFFVAYVRAGPSDSDNGVVAQFKVLRLAIEAADDLEVARQARRKAP